jgi:cell division protein FtsB
MNVFLVFLLCVITGLFVWYICDQYRESSLLRLGMQYQTALDELTAKNEALKAENEWLKKVIGETVFNRVHMDKGELESIR